MTADERAALIEDIRVALSTTPLQHSLTPEETQWVRMAIEAQAERAALRRAIIEKSLGSLVWSAIVGIGLVFFEYFRNHGFK